MIPRWENLPKASLRNQEMVTYMKEVLASHFEEKDFITTTRIQNYVKWGVMDPPRGRRYERIHLAQAIVLTILKTVLTTEEIARGIRLQSLLLGTEEAYNGFCQALEEALEEVRHYEEQGRIYPSESRYPALGAACRAFAYTRLTRKRINYPSPLEEVKYG